MNKQKIKLAIEIIDEILEQLPYDYDIHYYQYRKSPWKGKVLIGVTFPDLLSRHNANKIAKFIGKEINAYATKIKSISANRWYICFDVGSKT